MDLSRAIAYRDFALNTVAPVAGKPGAYGCIVETSDDSDRAIVEFSERRRVADGTVLLEPYVSTWTLHLTGSLFGQTRGDLFTALQELRAAMNPDLALLESPDTKGFLPFTYFIPHTGSAPEEVTLSARPLGLRWTVTPERSGTAVKTSAAIDGSALAVRWSADLVIDIRESGGPGGEGGPGGGGYGTASIRIAKTPDVQSVSDWGTAEFAIDIINDGSVPVFVIEVTDEMVPDCARDQTALTALIAAKYPANMPGLLKVGQSVSYSCSRPEIVAGFTNEAVVRAAQEGAEDEVTDSDTAVVTVLPPPAPFTCEQTVVQWRISGGPIGGSGRCTIQPPDGLSCNTNNPADTGGYTSTVFLYAGATYSVGYDVYPLVWTYADGHQDPYPGPYGNDLSGSLSGSFVSGQAAVHLGSTCSATMAGDPPHYGTKKTVFIAPTTDYYTGVLNSTFYFWCGSVGCALHVTVNYMGGPDPRFLGPLGEPLVCLNGLPDYGQWVRDESIQSDGTQTTFETRLPYIPSGGIKLFVENDSHVFVQDTTRTITGIDLHHFTLSSPVLQGHHLYYEYRMNHYP